MSEKKESPTSIVFSLQTASVENTKTGTFFATVTMRGLVNVDDMELWEKVLRRLDSLEVHQGETLITEALSMIEEKAQAEKKRADDLAEEFRVYRETSESEKSFAEVELRRLKALEDQLNRLSGLRVVKVVD